MTGETGQVAFSEEPLAGNKAGGNGGLGYDMLGEGHEDVSAPLKGRVYPPEPQPPVTPPSVPGMANGNTPQSTGGDSPFRISVTSPVKEVAPSKVPGVQETFFTYLVNTSTSLRSFSDQEVSVRRRFRDIVDLDSLLKENYRGYFIPPRPHRNVYQGKIRMSPTFIEERRSGLEKYLKQLGSHPIISRSEELRLFLEARGKLRECMAWVQLHPVRPPWYEGAVKLIRQISGKERTVPTVNEVTQPINARRDTLRAMRESFKSFKDNRKPSLYTGREQQLREETDVMQEFKLSVEEAWKWASIWMDRTEGAGRNFERVGNSFMNLSNYEVDAGYVRISGPGSVGKGCLRASALHRQFVNQSALPLSHIHDYMELMNSVMGALKSREEALNTVKTLEVDLETKKQKLTQSEVGGKSKQVEAIKNDVSALEASLTAAQSSYDRITAHNSQEMSRLRSTRQMEWADMLRGLASSQATFARHAMEVWIQVAEELGADKNIINTIRAQ